MNSWLAVLYVGLGGFIVFMCQALILGISTGVQTSAARRKGEGRPERAAAILNTALLLVLLWLFVGTAWLWAFLALWLFSPLPAWARVLAALAWAVVTGWCLVRLSYRTSWRVILLGVVVVFLIWSQ